MLLFLLKYKYRSTNCNAIDLYKSDFKKFKKVNIKPIYI